MYLLFVLFLMNMVYTFRLHKHKIIMYDEKLFTLSTAFSTSDF